MSRLRALPLLALLLGCVYYNGMYNTKRLAGSARHAEREGRTFEANDLWGQVVTRAESLVVRHPDSKYADQARVYQGIALSRLGQCPAALSGLARVGVADLDRDIEEEAALATGRCRLERGDPGSAAPVFAELMASRDPLRRQEAGVQYARALRLTGRPDEALATLDQVSDPRVPDERLLALAAGGHDDQALALADSLLALGDSTRVWDSVLTVVGRSNPLVASQLVDRFVGPSTPPALRGRRLLEDATRLEGVDSARAVERLRLLSQTGADTDPGQRAALRLLRMDLTRVADPGELAPLADSLDQIATGRGSAAQEALLLGRTIAAVRTAVDSGGPGAPQGDLRLFLAAETARDTLKAPALGAALFRQLVESWPESPYAPKALLAGQGLDPAWGEQVRSLLDERYATSPYLAFVRGEDAAGYRQLEDSLQSYAFALAAGARRQPPAAGRPQAPDDVRPGARQQRPNVPRRGLEP